MVNTRAKINQTQTCLSQASDHESTHSAALIGSNDDLLTEILLRLPATSILLFKSVSKHWQWLLSQRHFIRMHDHLLKSPGFFTTGKRYVPYDVENRSAHPFRDLDFFLDSPYIEIVQSCNGLLLLYNNSAIKYYVYNPTTKQYAIIEPAPGGYNARKTVCFMCLAFHQIDCVHYKLVFIRRMESYIDLFQIQIYSSDTGKWKDSVQSVFRDWSIFSEAVYWNGAIHWTPYHHNHYYFTIETEQLQTLPLPMEMMAFFNTKAMYFGESRGHLHLIVAADYDKTGIHLNVYEMLSDLSGWFVKYQLQLDELVGAFPEMLAPSRDYDFKMIDVVRGEKEEDTFIVLITKSNMLIRYNVHDKSYNNSAGPLFRFIVQAHRYVETLSSL